MATQARERLHVCLQLLHLDKTGLGQGCVQRTRTVALAQDEAVSLRPARSSGINFEYAKIQRAQDVGGREIATDVAKARAVDHYEVAPSDVGCELLETIDLRLVHHHDRLFPLVMDVNATRPGSRLLRWLGRSASRSRRVSPSVERSRVS